MASIVKYEISTGETRYRVRWTDPSGKKFSKTFMRKADAVAWRIEIERRGQLGTLFEEKPQSFGEFAGIASDTRTGRIVLTGDGWFERYRATVRRSSFDRRKDVLQHLRAFLGVRLDLITPGMLEDEVMTLVAAEHPRQAKAVHETVKMVLRSAATRGIKVDPRVLALKPPVYETKRRRQALTPELIDRLAEASDEPHLVVFAAYTGLRIGELLALREEDVSLRDGVVTPKGTARDGVRSDLTKSKAGQDRLIPLPSRAREAYRAQLERKLQRGQRTVPWAFPGLLGAMQRESKLAKRFKKASTAIGLDITFHDLRSTYASLMVRAGVHPKELQRLMGHKTFTVTMDLYTHLSDGDLYTAVDRLDAMLTKTREEAM